MSKKLALVALTVVVACGEDEEPNPPSPTGTIAGTVLGDGSAALAGAEVTAGSKTATTGTDGTFTIDKVAPGDVDVSVSADWYDGDEQSVTVVADQSVTADFQLTVATLRVESADATLALAFNASEDWTSDTVSIDHVESPTRAALEMALHYRNPALYQDPSGEAQVTPSTLPSVGTPSTLDFPDSGSVQALDQSSVADAAPTGDPEDGEALWEPALHYLLNEWSFDDATALFTAGVAVRQQKWGGSSTLPTQQIERVNLVMGEIWVEVVFQDFVDLDANITDSDGDGFREVWARINPAHYDAALYAELRDNYIAATHGTLELAEILDENLDILYSQGTNAQLSNTIGEPYTNTDLGGTVQYPFAVVWHEAISVANVFLVAP